MEIQLTPELEARLVDRARQNGQTPAVYAAELFARDLSSKETLDLGQVGHAPGRAIGNARRLSLLYEQEARNAPLADLTEVLGAWGRGGQAVDGLEFEREQREEWP